MIAKEAPPVEMRELCVISSKRIKMKTEAVDSDDAEGGSFSTVSYDRNKILFSVLESYGGYENHSLWTGIWTDICKPKSKRRNGKSFKREKSSVRHTDTNMQQVGSGFA